MKKCYFGILLLLTMVSYGQDHAVSKKPQPLQEASFKLYPNPAINDVVYITTSTNGIKEIIIYDVFGEIVLRERIKTKALNIARLVSGVYVLQVNENNKTMTRKLVVK